MSSQMKLADLPIATLLESQDLLLVSDDTYKVSRKITFADFNAQLSLEDLSDYEVYLTDIQTINDQLDLIIGDGTLVHSLSDIDELILSAQDSIAAVRDSLRNTIDTLRENVDNDLLNKNQITSTINDRIKAVEDHELNAGLASGFLHINQFLGG